MSVLFVVIAIMGLALLMVIHEGGHYLAARYFGLRVTKFSIGFGPAIFKKQPKGSPTTYQIAIIPFLAYVQIAGMNPFEESDPADKASYANAPVHARIVTIFGGALANYLAASVLFFLAFMVGGQPQTTTFVDVMEGSAAAKGAMRSGDKIVEIEGTPILEWANIRPIIVTRAGTKTSVVVERGCAQVAERDCTRVSLEVTPEGDAENGEGRLGVRSVLENVPMSVSSAAMLSVTRPPQIVYRLVADLGQLVMRKAKPEFMGPVGIVGVMAESARSGVADYLRLLGILSAYLAGFNLLPVPALDGARLMFLGYEAATRRRPNARVEAHIHAVGLLLLLTLVAVVTVFSDIPGFGD